jgi:hypothetical protein
MPAVPAFCDKCGAIFDSGIFVENSYNVSFSGSGAGPCPRCGGMGHIPDGVYNFIGNTIEVVAAPTRTVDELTRLAEILRESQARKESPEKVASRIKQEVPGFSGLADLLPQNRTEFLSYLMILLAIIQLVLQAITTNQTTQNITINQVIQQVTVQPPTPARKINPSINTRNTRKAVGRNDPCVCGSGKKYKKCCGR